MKKIYQLSIAALLACNSLFAQETVYPAADYKGLLFIKNGTVHVGNGTVLENATIEINKGKIVRVGKDIPIPAGDVKVYDATGKKVYPGLILPVTDLGLKEIANGVRASNDNLELGDYNPNIKAVTAYNTDSRVINIIRANGILLAGITPQGGTISGSSSVVHLDAWNWEDAIYSANNAIHLNMPSFINRTPRRFAGGPAAATDAGKRALAKVDEIKDFFNQAKAYHQNGNNQPVNARFEAVKGLFSKKQKLFVHANQVKQMLVAIDFMKEFDFDMVLVGASESFQIANLLKANNIPVILDQQFDLPATEDDDIDQPFKTPATLQKAGVLFALNDDDVNTRYRNLSYNAGQAAAFGLSKEEALQAITLNAAKILGIDKQTGSIEAGKDANIIVCEGDILDMKESTVLAAFIQGRSLNLDNKQKQLYERYKHKYQIK